jgi:hypothetical protein
MVNLEMMMGKMKNLGVLETKLLDTWATLTMNAQKQSHGCRCFKGEGEIDTCWFWYT